MPNKNRTEAHYIEAAKNSISISDMCRKLGLVPIGGNFNTVKKNIVKYNLDISHFLGQAHARGTIISLSPNSKATIKKRLIESRGHQCESCKNTEWLEAPITLELEHIDGNNTNNDYINLLLLCPNCHSQTKTWRRAKSSFSTEPKKGTICECGNVKHPAAKLCKECRYPNAEKNREAKENKVSRSYSKREQKFCSCGTPITHEATQCVDCSHNAQKRLVWPDIDILVAQLRKSSYLAVGRELGVSDNAVRKYVRKHNLDPKTFQKIVGTE